MPEVRIDKLALRVAGIDHRQGKRLAEKFAAGLNRISVEEGWPERTEVIRLSVQASPGASAERLAEELIDKLTRELRRS